MLVFDLYMFVLSYVGTSYDEVITRLRSPTASSKKCLENPKVRPRASQGCRAGDVLM
jgi:hypothetical protein